MHAGTNLTDREKGLIEAYAAENWTKRGIANELDRSKKAVHNYQKRLKSPKLLIKQGRKPKFSDRMMKSLIRKAPTGEHSVR